MTRKTRRAFAKLSAAAVGAAIPAIRDAGGNAQDDRLQSEFLFDLALDTRPASTVESIGMSRVIVEVTGGTFEGPKLKGTVITPGGDWIVRRADGSLLLDVRLLLQTDDAQKIYMTWHGISYTPQEGTQYARIAPVFETGPGRYGWLNEIVAVGVRRSVPGKVAYRIYQIL